ncbi:MAG: response regulator [Bacteroidia bacterium]
MDKIKILLVDDDEDDRDFFVNAVNELNIPHQILTATDGQGLFEILENGDSFDLIFLDINIPKFNGRTCLKRIKTHEIYKAIPVIIYSGSSYGGDIDDTYQSGAHYYFIKPNTRINLLSGLKIIFSINWKSQQTIPSKDNFVISISYNERAK